MLSSTNERTRLEEERVLPLAYDSPGVQWDWVQRLLPKTRNVQKELSKYLNYSMTQNFKDFFFFETQSEVN